MPGYFPSATNPSADWEGGNKLLANAIARSDRKRLERIMSTFVKELPLILVLGQPTLRDEAVRLSEVL